MRRIGLTLAVTLACAAVGQVALVTPAWAQDGEKLYNDNCSACHQKTGLGIKGAFPSLAGDKFVLGDPKMVAATMLYGRGGMPAFKDSLKDPVLADILTYVRASWGNKAKPMTAAQFAVARSGPPPSNRLQAH